MILENFTERSYDKSIFCRMDDRDYHSAWYKIILVGLTEQIPRTEQNNCINVFHSLFVLYSFPISNFKGTDVMMFTTSAEDMPVKYSIHFYDVI